MGRKGNKRVARGDAAPAAVWDDMVPDLSVRAAPVVPPEEQRWNASGWAIVLEPLFELVNDEALWARMHVRHAHAEAAMRRGDARGVRERLRHELELWMDAVQEAFLKNESDHALGLWTGALPVLRDTRRREEGKAHRAVLEDAVGDAAMRGDDRGALSFRAALDLLYVCDPLMGEGPYAGPAALAGALRLLAAYDGATDDEDAAEAAAWEVERVRREAEWNAAEVARADKVAAAVGQMDVADDDDAVPADAVTDENVSSDSAEYSDEEEGSSEEEEGSSEADDE